MLRHWWSRPTYSIYDVISYLIKRLGGEVKGVKKLMKLIFLIQYERKGDKIIKYLFKGRPVTRAEFYIWSNGPMSNEVYEVIDERLRIDDREIPVIIKLPLIDISIFERRLPEIVKKRIDDIVNRYGWLYGFELERISLKILDLDDLKKSEYMGSPIDDYIRTILGESKLEKIDLIRSSKYKEKQEGRSHDGLLPPVQS